MSESENFKAALADTPSIMVGATPNEYFRVGWPAPWVILLLSELLERIEKLEAER